VSGEHAVAAFVSRELGCDATRVVRLEAFATNAVYEVDTSERRLVVKASGLHGALRAEAWACTRGAAAGWPVPAILAFGRLGDEPGPSALVMTRLPGRAMAGGDGALRQVGAGLRRLHGVQLPGFGWLAEASWRESGEPSLAHGSWLDFVKGIAHDARRLADRSAAALPIAAAAEAAIEAHAVALAAVSGSLCHGDLKLTHALIAADRLSGVIDWGDAVVGDPLWDVARFAHRADPASVSLLLEGYDPARALAGELAWRLPLYGALWNLVDAIVDHRLGRPVEVPLAAAAAYAR